MSRLTPDPFGDAFVWASLPELPAPHQGAFPPSPQMQTLEDAHARRSLVGSQQLNVGHPSPTLQRKSAPNLLVGNIGARSPRLNRVADTQFNPLAAPAQSIPLPVPTPYGLGLQSLSLPNSPLTSRSEGLLQSPGFVGPGHVSTLSADLEAHLRLMPAVTQPRERSSSIPVTAASLSVASPKPTRRNTSADRSDQRKLADKIADQKRRQAEHEREMAEILGRSPPSATRSPSGTAGEARSPLAASADQMAFFGSQYASLGQTHLSHPDLAQRQSLVSILHSSPTAASSMDWSDMAQLNLGLSLRDLDVSPQMTSPSPARSSDMIPRLELPQDDPNTLLLEAAASLSAEEVEAILSGRAL